MMVPVLSAAREAIEVKAQECLAELRSSYDECDREESIPTDVSLVDRCLTYEVIDFAVVDKDGSLVSPREAMSEDSGAAREIAGFIRMSRPGVWEHYSHAAVVDLASHDIGNRVDDLFLVNGRRMFRSHPDQREDVGGWFRDLCLGIGILLATECYLDFESRMLSPISPLFPSLSGPDAERDGVAKLMLTEGLLSRLADPFIFERAIGHAFFRQLLDEVRDSLGLLELHASVRSRVNEIRANVEALVQTTIAAAAARSSEDSKRLTVYVVRLTVLLLVLGAAQILATLLR